VAVAAGDVVMVEDNLGLRLTRILPPAGQEFA
jgi:flagellar motor switch/type III secretory pathway protein FliN